MCGCLLAVCTHNLHCFPPPHPCAVSATACAENGGQATASASATSTATAVASAATTTYAAAFASLASCQAPPAGAPPAPQALQCIILPNTNLDGDVVQSTTASDAGACCDLCKSTSGCNTFAFCGLPSPGWWVVGGGCGQV